MASACAKMVGNWDAVTSEACTVRLGMSVTRNLGLDHVIFEMDSAEVAHALNGNIYKLDYSDTF